MAGPPPPTDQSIQGSLSASDLKQTKEIEPQRSSEERPPAPPTPPTQEELHQKYDITKQDATKAEISVVKQEKYDVVAAVQRQWADDHPFDKGASERAAKSEAFAHKHYEKNVKPFEEKMMGPDGKPSEYRDYEPGVDAESVKKLAMRAHLDHKIEPVVNENGVKVGNGGQYNWKEMPEIKAEVHRDEARDKARDAVSRNADAAPAKAAPGMGL
jgi:hypothetical protein